MRSSAPVSVFLRRTICLYHPAESLNSQRRTGRNSWSRVRLVKSTWSHLAILLHRLHDLRSPAPRDSRPRTLSAQMPLVTPTAGVSGHEFIVVGTWRAGVGTARLQRHRLHHLLRISRQAWLQDWSLPSGQPTHRHYSNGSAGDFTSYRTPVKSPMRIKLHLLRVCGCDGRATNFDGGRAAIFKIFRVNITAVMALAMLPGQFRQQRHAASGRAWASSPAASADVRSQSYEMLGRVISGAGEAMWPGQRASVGTRSPPSTAITLDAVEGAVAVEEINTATVRADTIRCSGHCPDVKTAGVLSSMLRSFSRVARCRRGRHQGGGWM